MKNLDQDIKNLERRIRELEKKKSLLLSAKDNFRLRVGAVTAIQEGPPKTYTVQEQTVDGTGLWQWTGVRRLDTDKRTIGVNDKVTIGVDKEGNRFILPGGDGLVIIQQGGTRANTLKVTDVGSTTIETAKTLVFYEDTSLFYNNTRTSDNQRKYMGVRIPETDSKACHVQAHGDEADEFETSGTATDDFDLTVTIGVDGSGNITSLDSLIEDNEFCQCSLNADVLFQGTNTGGDVATFLIRTGGFQPPCSWGRFIGFPLVITVNLRNGTGANTGLWVLSSSQFVYTGPAVTSSVNGTYTCISSTHSEIDPGDTAIVVNAESCP